MHLALCHDTVGESFSFGIETASSPGQGDGLLYKRQLPWTAPGLSSQHTQHSQINLSLRTVTKMHLALSFAASALLATLTTAAPQPQPAPQVCTGFFARNSYLHPTRSPSTAKASTRANKSDSKPMANANPFRREFSQR